MAEQRLSYISRSIENPNMDEAPNLSPLPLRERVRVRGRGMLESARDPLP